MLVPRTRVAVLAPAYPLWMIWPPTEEEALDLPVDELAIRLLRKINGGKTTRRNEIARIRSKEEVARLRASHPQGTVVASSSTPLPREYEYAVSEAWQWLLVNGLIVEIPMEENWFVVSRLGTRLLTEAADPAAHVSAIRRLEVDLLPEIKLEARPQFLLGKFDAAVFLSMRLVENRVRSLGGYSDSIVGVTLARKAFAEHGPLTDPSLDAGESQAIQSLFAGALGTFKNPASHREVDYEDPAEAVEVVLLADLLLRMLRRIEKRIQSA
jgi:uncharacterized protein (TIGR02391 family)